MKIIIVSATPFEIAPILKFLEEKALKKSFSMFQYGKIEVYPLITGVGMVQTIYALAKSPEINDADYIFNCGIAGSFERDLSLGAVVEVIKDRFGDLGVEEADGSFTDVYEMDLIAPDNYPYSDGWIINEKSKLDTGLLKVSGITVNKVHGHPHSINHIKSKYYPHVETMEGAAFMMYCKNMMTNYHQIRSISNYVESRNKEHWNIELAIDALNEKMIGILNQLRN